MALATIAAILIRPWRLNEAVWPVSATLILLVTRVTSPGDAWRSVADGLDVYLFLAGMMLLAEIARAEQIFVWTAQRAVRFARGSPHRLFAGIFALCIVVTAFFSNDATVVVLTPAVIAIASRARISPMPFVFSCAFVANAASFVLPISNPANLVVYGGRLPTLGPWLAIYLVPSIASVGTTYALLRWLMRAELRSAAMSPGPDEDVALRKRALFALIASALAMLGASTVGLPLGTVTAVAALCALAVALTGRAGATLAALRRIDYAILLFVAGLFVVFGTLDANGALTDVHRALATIARAGEPLARIATAFGAAMLANLVNNLPVGLAARYAFAGIHVQPPIQSAALIGINLGPNLSVTGSLATLLWLSALRSARVEMSGLRFLRAGAIVMPLPLLLAALALR